MVVHALPMPRSRNANIKLHTAGNSEPQIDAVANDGKLSKRP
jgi:hypothetical protein